MVADNFNAFRSDGTEKPKNPDGPGQNSIFWPTVEDATASDPTTVVVTMKAPFTAFPETLATENSVIVNLVTRRKLGAPDGTYGTAGADGTGPFTFSSYQPGTEVVVNRWDDYPGTNIPYVTNPGPAYLDSVKWVPILEAGQRANEIEGGTVNVVKNPAPQDIGAAAGQLGPRCHELPEPLELLPGAKPRADEVRLRRRQRPAGHLHGDRPPGARGLDLLRSGGCHLRADRVELQVVRLRRRAVQPVRSREGEVAARRRRLDRGLWRDPREGRKKLSFTVTSNDLYQPTTAAIDQAIVPMLADVGVEMKLKVPDAAEYFGIVAAAGAPEKADTVDAWTFEWLWSSPVDLLIYFQAFPSKAFNGDLPDIAAAVEKWQTAPDIETLEAAARAFQLAWAEQLPEIPILTRNDIWVAPEERDGLYAARVDALPALQRRLDRVLTSADGGGRPCGRPPPCAPDGQVHPPPLPLCAAAAPDRLDPDLLRSAGRARRRHRLDRQRDRQARRWSTRSRSASG